jgi:hypothetical protein
LIKSSQKNKNSHRQKDLQVVSPTFGWQLSS